LVARVAFSLYIENVGSSINEKKLTLERELNDVETRDICNNFLSQKMLDHYFQLSNVTQELEEKAIANRFDKDAGVYGFLKAVLIGVTYNFIFVILLILVFAAAKDQVVAIFDKLGIVEQTKPSNQTKPPN